MRRDSAVWSIILVVKVFISVQLYGIHILNKLFAWVYDIILMFFCYVPGSYSSSSSSADWCGLRLASWARSILLHSSLFSYIASLLGQARSLSASSIHLVLSYWHPEFLRPDSFFGSLSSAMRGSIPKPVRPRVLNMSHSILPLQKKISSTSLLYNLRHFPPSFGAPWIHLEFSVPRGQCPCLRSSVASPPLSRLSAQWFSTRA